MTKIVTHLPDGDRVSNLEKGTNLLEGLLNDGVPMHYDCKKGNCGTCRVKVILGKDNLPSPSLNEVALLDSEEINRGLSRLACEVTVDGNEIEVQQRGPQEMSTTLEDW